MNISCILIGGVAAWSGATMAIHGKKYIDMAKATLNWPSTQGCITNSTVVRSLNRICSVEPRIEYEYVAAGIKRQAGALSPFGESTGLTPSRDKKFAEACVAKYPIGKTVDVFYNPENPGETRLKPGANAWTYTGFGIGLGLFIVGIVTIAWGLWRFS